MKFETRSVHSGVQKDPNYGSVITPIYPSSTFMFPSLHAKGEFDYTRSGNPTRRAAEENIASLEEGVDCRCTSTGMSAITTVLHLLKPGDHVITGNDIYGGTYRLMADVFTQMGISFSFVDMRNIEEYVQAYTPQTKMVWIETPSNPLLNVVDIAAIAKRAQQKSATVVVDNTFLSPYLQKPLQLGADIVVHSTTKYINGHSDVVGGAIICKYEEMAEQIGFLVNALGVGEAPFDSWLVLRGVKTLALRMQKHCENAQAMAEFLKKHPKVEKVYYPGLPDHPDHRLASTQAKGFGGMLSFDLADEADLETLFSRLKYFSLAESLGGVESLIESPWYMSHASMSETARREGGIKPTNVRVSLGIEDVGDLISDFEQALGHS